MPTVAHRADTGGSGASGLTKADHGRTLRLDIEGMRAVAVGSVLAAHAGIPFLAGGFVGVDVFFVLSGFLITGLLAREVSRTGRVSLSSFWARRVKRLLPASATVLLFSSIVTYAYLPITQRQVFSGDITSAALYVVNWRLADRGVDYLAEDIGQSPVQHYWSLAVEEQFYLVWPILMLVIGVIAARRWKRVAFVVLAAVTISSLVYSIAHTSSSPQTAYFVSTTRIWELGIGALLALSATAVARIPGVLRAISGWLGIVLIAYAVLFFDTSTGWPGANALVPTIGAALVIASGIAATPGSPQRLLSVSPMVWIGGLSYSIYLWHWPMLVAAQAKYPDLRLRWTVLLMIASFVPAWLSHKLIENPVRFGTPFKPTARGLGVGAGLTALGVGVGLALNASVAIGTVVSESSPADSPGAAAIDDPANAGVVWSDLKAVKKMRPLAIDAPNDRPPLYDDDPGCQVPVGDANPKTCDFGDTSADRTVVIVGDSKMVQWETVLDTIAKREHWKLVTMTKSACSFADANNAGKDELSCRRWGKAALGKILAMRPDLVISSHRRAKALPGGKTGTAALSQDAMVQGTARYWRQITRAGIPLVTLLDNPEPITQPVYECVAKHPRNLTRCSFDKAQAIAESGAPTQRKAAAEVPGVSIIDMTDVICPDRERCATVIGNVLVYRQGTHITRTYIDSAEPQLSARLFDATEGRFGRRQ